ncbi:hypothetical protein PR202_ga09617 [Eleusine coracana subsp. coracana]|uniref:Uncharacterized protein n=1 Tax=Eleusine coracana subsp. coracana TaxID=191504 RepID=A0AAV5C376_ELECO|nr:hypothetical protein PR202_ga09617 [Eleusine coracana subsp. coracana]
MSADEDFGKDFLSSWKLPKSGEDTIDFNVESVPKGSKKFNFDSLDDFGFDGAFDKLSSFKMGMPGLDFSSPVKKKAKHKSSNGDDLSEGKKETEKDFSFSFDFNELGKFNLGSKLGMEEKSTGTVTGKTNPISSEGNKDTPRNLSAKGTDIREDNKSKEQTPTQDTCTLRSSHPTRQEIVKNGCCPTPNVNAADSSDVMQEDTNVIPSRKQQTNINTVSNDRHGEHSKEAYSSKAPAHKYFQNASCSAVSVQDPTQVPAHPVNSKGGPKVDFSKVHVSREGNDNEQSISSQSRNTSTVNPSIPRRSVSQLDSQNEVEENVSHNEVSQDNQSFSSNPKLSTRRSCAMKNNEEGTSAPKSPSSLVQRFVFFTSFFIYAEESVIDPKAPTVLKHIKRSPSVRKSPQTVPELENQTLLRHGTPKAHMDNEISSVMACETGDISDLELPALLENDGHVEKAEACRKELEDVNMHFVEKETHRS